MGAFLIRGMSLRTILAQYMARKTGATRGKDGNMHMGDLSRNLIAFVSMLGDNVPVAAGDRKSTRLNSSHRQKSYAVFCLKKKKKKNYQPSLVHPHSGTN